MGLYFKWSIVLFYVPIIGISKLKKKFLKPKEKTKFKLISLQRYFRYIKLVFPSRILMIMMISSIISNTIVLYQNQMYETYFQEGKELKGEAIVVDEGKEKEYDWIYKIKICKINQEKGKNTYVYLRVNKKVEESLSYGDKISFTGEFQKPEGKRNFGGFNYASYLKSLKIHGTVKAKKIEILAKDQGNPFLKFTFSISHHIKNKIEELLPKEEASMLKGILLGDSQGIDEGIQERFRISSLTHLLAVSGMQVTYIITGISYLLSKRVGKRPTKIFSILLILFYMQLTGFSPSIVRASFMGILMILSGIVYRKNDTWNSLACSLFFLLLWNPFLLTNVGLQLSYLGTIGMMIFQKTIFQMLKNIKMKRKWKDRISRKMLLRIDKIKEEVSVTLSAQLAIFPCLIYQFHLFGTYFGISNFLAGMIIGPLTIAGCLVVFISFIFVPLAKFLSFFLGICIQTLFLISNVSNLPFSKIYFSSPSLFFISIYYILILSFSWIYWLYQSSKLTPTQQRIRNIIALFRYQGKRKKKQFIKIVIFMGIIIFIFQNYPKDLKIHFVDVGQGDCTLIETPKGKSILIDGGGSTSKTFDVGESTLLPYLLDRGYTKLDVIFISHFDQDHVGGIFTILEELKVKKIIIPKQKENSENYQKFLSIVRERKNPVEVVTANDKIQIEEDLSFTVLWPREKQITENALNNNSLVMRMDTKETTMLFTGDIEEIAETELLKEWNRENFQADILKVAHHGSKTSTTKSFLEAVNPKIALIGVGKNNMFGHPSDEVIEKLQNAGVKIYRTDECGEITITINAKGKIMAIRQVVSKKINIFH